MSRLRYSAPVQWLFGLRYRVADFWFMRDKGNLLFFSLFAAAILLIGGMVYLVYVDHLRIRWAQQRQQDLMCLARNVYHESRGEPMAGQYAVAEVTMNRVASRHFPDTVCDVVYEKRLDTVPRPARRRILMDRIRLCRNAAGHPVGQGEAGCGGDIRRAARAGGRGRVVLSRRQHRATLGQRKKRVAQIGRHIFYE